MTGMELIAAIGAEWPELPTILATGYAELPPGSHPAQPKLAKPFRQHDLVRALEQVMPEPGARRVLKFRSR